MLQKPFHFKQFSVAQNLTAMKVGTDGVLLGAWAKLTHEVNSILDVGSGTGLIGLMMAQRSNAATIDAVELEENAYIQTVENFEKSEWSDRLFCYHASFQQFAEEMDETYDFIISNPPFYNNNHNTQQPNKTLAKHTQNLSFEELLKGTSQLLSKDGSCAFVIPISEENNFLTIAKNLNLFPNYITRVRGNVNAPIKRSLLQLSTGKELYLEDELTIEIERHVYTEKYRTLVSDFYVNM